MAHWTEQSIADELYQAEAERRDRRPFTDDWPSLDVETAYRTQARLIQKKTATGQTVTGVKLGLTSLAKQKRMGIASPITGWITDRMQLAEGTPIPMGDLIHPRIEPEIAFVMGRRLEGPDVTAETALSAVESVRAAFEVIDSRYQDFRFQLPDVIADNASSSRFFLGSLSRHPKDLDLAAEECVLRIDDRIVGSATGSAVQGHPAEALAQAVNALAERGIALRPGWIVLTGGLTDAATVNAGERITAEFANLGSLTVVGKSPH
ncbi:2-keto-4-pentenoate hydratase [Embleya scabrispora]|uniref:2-keto-4-pentenoate hydratase n=1 Tax=Embleya scabrispora TaxID=159449 RepID=UPI00035FF81E|nr:fumarylacetoacetate hydrolase family protein [Embleya scabrispora]MYS82122.1 4-oxalocrotonate decarboxylase [Streptomyces sp. SID5474]